MKFDFKKIGKLLLFVIIVVCLVLGTLTAIKFEKFQNTRLTNLEKRPAVIKEVVATATPTATPSAKVFFKKVVPTVVPSK